MDWLATLFSIVGVFLNAKQKIICWPIWLISNILWIIHIYPHKEYALILTWVVFGIMNVYGWIQWSKERHLDNSK